MARSRQFPPSVDPGKPVEPPLPAGWARFKFGDVLKEVERPVSLEAGLEYQLVTAKRSRGGIEPRSKQTGSQIKVKSQFTVREGDFLISRRQIVHGACGAVPAHLEGAIVSNEYDVLRPTPELELDYLKLLSHTPYFQRTCFHSSVGVDIEKMVFRLRNWLQYYLPLPPVWEQRRIATILNSVDEAIAKAKTVVERLESLFESMARNLLTGGLPSQYTAFEDTEIGKIPRSWSLRRLMDCGTLLSGGTPSKDNSEFWSGPIPWISPKDMKSARIADSIDHVSASAIGNGTRQVPSGTLLMVVRGMILAHSFPVALTVSPVTFNQDIKALQPSPDFNAEFLLYWLRGQKARVLSVASSSSHGTRTIPTDSLLNLLVPCPPLSEQQRIASVLRNTELAAGFNSEELKVLQKFKATLASSLLSGQIRVTPNEATS